MTRFFILNWEQEDELHDLDLLEVNAPDGFICAAESISMGVHWGNVPVIVVDHELEKEIVEHYGEEYDGSAPSREQVFNYLMADRHHFGLYPFGPKTNDAEPRLMATFRPQADQGGYCNDVDGAVQFDATGKFLELDLKTINNFQDHNDDSDNLSEGLHEREIHGGPFEVDCDIDGWLEANGIKGREALTQEQLDQLRIKYGVEVQ